MSLHYVSYLAHGERRFLQVLTDQWHKDPKDATGFATKEAAQRVSDVWATKHAEHAGWCVYSVKKHEGPGLFAPGAASDVEEASFESSRSGSQT